jgi:hypothetical protein
MATATKHDIEHTKRLKAARRRVQAHERRRGKEKDLGGRPKKPGSTTDGTVVRLAKATHERLFAYMRVGENYDDGVRRLLDAAGVAK